MRNIFIALSLPVSVVLMQDSASALTPYTLNISDISFQACPDVSAGGSCPPTATYTQTIRFQQVSFNFTDNNPDPATITITNPAATGAAGGFPTTTAGQFAGRFLDVTTQNKGSSIDPFEGFIFSNASYDSTTNILSFSRTGNFTYGTGSNAFEVPMFVSVQLDSPLIDTGSQTPVDAGPNTLITLGTICQRWANNGNNTNCYSQSDLIEIPSPFSALAIVPLALASKLKKRFSFS